MAVRATKKSSVAPCAKRQKLSGNVCQSLQLSGNVCHKAMALWQCVPESNNFRHCVPKAKSPLVMCATVWQPLGMLLSDEEMYMCQSVHQLAEIVEVN